MQICRLITASCNLYFEQYNSLAVTTCNRRNSITCKRSYKPIEFALETYCNSVTFLQCNRVLQKCNFQKNKKGILSGREESEENFSHFKTKVGHQTVRARAVG